KSRPERKSLLGMLNAKNDELVDGNNAINANSANSANSVIVIEMLGIGILGMVEILEILEILEIVMQLDPEPIVGNQAILSAMAKTKLPTHREETVAVRHM